MKEIFSHVIVSCICNDDTEDFGLSPPTEKKKDKKKVFGMVLFFNYNPIFSTLLWLLFVCNAVMANFIARLGEFRFCCNKNKIQIGIIHNLRKINIIDIEG
jgi:hypothetical protein